MAGAAGRGRLTAEDRYHLKDAIGRTWQLGTMQVDFMMPGRLGAEYVDENSQKKHPVMLHRAIVGSMERFLGILIEHHAGQFPTWLAPTQVVVANITDAQADYVSGVTKTPGARLPRQLGFA